VYSFFNVSDRWGWVVNTTYWSLYPQERDPVREIRPVGAELLHADGQTDMMKLTVTCCSFANVPKKELAGFKLFSDLPLTIKSVNYKKVFKQALKEYLTTLHKNLPVIPPQLL
jgi:hypothetical protein